MPQVPYLSQPRVSPQPLPGPRLSPNAPQEAFGGGVASQTAPDLSGVAHVAAGEMQAQQRVAEEEKAKADAVNVDDKGAQATNYLTSRLHGTPDADGYAGDPGLLNKHGQDVFAEPEKFRTEAAQVATTLRNQLTNDDQKIVFDKRWEHEFSSAWEQVQRHVGTEREKYANQVAQSAIDSQRNKAEQSYDDPTIVEPSIAASAAIIARHAKDNGLPQEFAAEQIAKNTSAIRLTVVQSMLDNEQDLAASQYFTQHKTEFVGRDFLQAEKLTNAGSVRAQSQQHADTILKQWTNIPDAVAAAQQIEEPKVRDETEQRIRRHFADLASDQRQQRESSFQALSTILEKNGGNVDRLKTSPNWFDLTPQDHNALELRARRMAHPEDYGTGDPEQFTTLLNQAYFNPDEFSQLDILTAKGLNTSQKTRLMSLQRTIGAKDEAPLRQDVTHAEADSRLYMRKAEAAKVAGDKDAQAEAERMAALADVRVIQAHDALTAHRQRVAGQSPAPLTVPTTSTTTPSPASAAPSTGNIDLRSNPVGLTPAEPVAKMPFTQSMLDDAVRRAGVLRGGRTYPDYLRHMGVDVPDNIDALIAAEKEKETTAKAPAKPKEPKKPPTLSIERDAAGRVIKIGPSTP